MRFATLQEWLDWQETLHPSPMDLGLERVAAVHGRLFSAPLPCPVITVAGTNGKGSTVAMLEAILRAAGYRTGAYTSPHLFRYNERVRLDGGPADDATLCEAFAAVDAARGDTTLTYFEFGTLAALWCFHQAAPEVVILEVGMGGRLDAVNVVDPDVAVITTVDLDHVQWLGGDRDTIAGEKAGILRPGRPAVSSDPDTAAAIVETAAALGAPLHRLGAEYRVRERDDGAWDWLGPDGRARHALPLPALRGAHQVRNAAGALMALELLAPRLPLPQAAVREGLQAVRLPGRLQVEPGAPTVVYDVAHNPQAARTLAAALAAMGGGPLHAVLAMYADKDIQGVTAPLLPLVEHWHLAPLPPPRGASTRTLAQVLAAAGARCSEHASVAAALAAARAAVPAPGRVVVFGSFQTVEAAAS